jgi:tetratricopeptide (TPR) repeat protein
MTTTSNRIKRSSRNAVRLCVCLCLSAVAGTATSSGQGPSDSKDLEKGLLLLARGRYEKAIELLHRAHEASGGRSAPALIGLARAYNDEGRPERALVHAEDARALLVDDPAGEALAAVEAALAIAAGAAPRASGFEEAIGTVRELLGTRDRSELTDGLRIRLCTARSRLDDESPFSLLVLPVDPPRLLAPEAGIRKPTKIYAPAPSPGDVRQRETLLMGDEITIRAVIDVDGCVVDPTVVGSDHGEWKAEVLQTVSVWTFDPARIEGVAVPVFFHLSMRLHR